MSERVISDPTVAGWELNPDTGYWMWAAGSGGGGSIQDGDTEGQITTWDGDEWTPDGAVVVDADGNVGIGTSNPNAYSNFTTLTLDGATHSMIDFEAGGTLMAEVLATGNELRLQTVQPDGELILKSGNNKEAMRIDADGNVNITGKLFINGDEVTAGGGASLWTDNGDGTISSAKTAKAPDFIAT